MKMKGYNAQKDRRTGNRNQGKQALDKTVQDYTVAYSKMNLKL